MTTFLAFGPFVGLLMAIALGPLVCPTFWEKYHRVLSCGAACVALVSGGVVTGDWTGTLLSQGLRPFVNDFVPFVVLLSGLYVITGGLGVRLQVRATPLANVLFLGFFAIMAGLIGTTGAAMVGIRPLLEMNQGRRHRRHTVIFFIILVCNVGGILSAVGDPPLFVGFLKGVPFFWPTQNLWGSFVWVGGYLLILYGVVETVLWWRESPPLSPLRLSPPHVVVTGKVHMALLAAVLLTLVCSAHIHLGTLHLGHGVPLPVTDLVRTLMVLSLAGVSLWIKPLAQRAQEKWHLQPLGELVVLFFGIFITAEPVVHWLNHTLAHTQGGVFSIFTTPSATQALAYFWGTGLLSSFLDNAPTYMIFFSLAGGSAPVLTGPLALILTAISTGAVFMGALTYIGNAPNLLVKTIVEKEYALTMPSFLTYTFWVALILMPPLVGWSLWAL